MSGTVMLRTMLNLNNKSIIIVYGLLISICAVLSPILTPPASAAQISRVVTTTANSGVGSLRQAIIDANANATTTAAPHQITFNIPGSGVQTIVLTAALTQPNKPTVIDGTSQPGSSCGELVPAIGTDTNTPHNLMIEIDGSAAPATFNRGLFYPQGGYFKMVGVSVIGPTAGGNNSTIVHLDNVETVLECNYFGVKADGTTPGVVGVKTQGIRGVGYANSRPVLIQNNIVHGGSAYEITLNGTAGAPATGFTVRGNLIGTDRTGQTAIAASTATGLGIGNASGTLVERNLISGNASGLVLSNVQNGRVIGNRIGTNLSTTVPVPNNSFGIQAHTGTATTIIGGANAADANVIANNTQSGVTVYNTASTVAIRGNRIFNNGTNGIDLRGVTNQADQNDAPSNLDSDTGGNNLQNYPRRSTLTKCDNSTETRTVLRSAANTTYIVDFYANPSGRDSSGYGEGEQYIGFVTVTTDANGYVEINPPNVTNLSMTATDPAGNTSEFSNERAISFSNCGANTYLTSDPNPYFDGTATRTGFIASTPPLMVATVSGENVSPNLASPNVWSVGDNTLATPLADGIYDVSMLFTDAETTMTSSATIVGALTIDATAPSGILNSQTTHIASPQLSGTVDDTTATIELVIEGNSYFATNNGDGTWVLPEGSISPDLAVGAYSVELILTDTLFNSASSTYTNELTIVRGDADAPTVGEITGSTNRPIIRGTYDDINSQSLRVRVGNVTYVLGVDSQLTVDGPNWTLDLSGLESPLTPGSYDVLAEVTSRSGATFSDATSDELVVTASVVDQPNSEDGATGGLANTGMNSIIAIATTIGLLVSAALSIYYSSRSSKTT